MRDSRTVELTWQLPFAPTPFYASKPSSYLSHLLGHEGAGSVLSLLKQHGWANGLSSGQFSSASDFSIFGCQVREGKKPLLKKEEGVDTEDFTELYHTYQSFLCANAVHVVLEHIFFETHV